MGKKKFNKSFLTKLFKGFRPGIKPKHRINLQYLEKLDVLTSIQHNIVQEALNHCTYTKPLLDDKGEQVLDDKGETVQKLVITFSECYIARLFALLEKPYNEAKVDHLGNEWEPPKKLSEEDIKKAIEEKKKSLSKEDMQETK